MPIINGNEYDRANLDGTNYANESTGFVPLINDIALHVYGAFRSSSLTSLLVGDGNKSLIIEPYRPLYVGSWVRVEARANSAIFMEGAVTVYDAATGALTLNVATGDSQGAGTLADWLVYSMGRRGKTGTASDLASETAFGVVEVATQAEVDAGADPIRVLTPATARRVKRSARTANTILGVADRGALIEVTSGSFTQTFTAVATLGDGWWCFVKNSGTGDVTLDPNGSETIDALTSYVMYPGEMRLIQCTGSALFSVVLHPYSRTFAASGTWIKPPGYLAHEVDALGGGGGGAGGQRQATGSLRVGGGGGGGGSRVRRRLVASVLAATVTVTIGAGGAGGPAATTDNHAGTTGNAGGNTTFGGHLTAFGGAPGNAMIGGGGAGTLAGTFTQSGGAPRTGPVGGFGGGDGGAAGVAGNPSGDGGGGGGGGGQGGVMTVAPPGGACVNGGGGGGGGSGIDNSNVWNIGSSGGTAPLGNGGNGGPTPGLAGSDAGPGGGGGGGAGQTNGSNSGPGGAGGRGEVTVTGVV